MQLLMATDKREAQSYLLAAANRQIAILTLAPEDLWYIARY